jgi:YebC/PmpR family DNA-binding regulatory protein
MSGHSKWANIKHRKGAEDARRGKVFTKVIKEIMIAARTGGGDPSGNPRLRSALINARTNNMPKDNIERAIKKGTGELEGVHYDESSYEGYGPGGAAVLVESLSDNKNRTVADIRHAFNKYGGNMGENGCVAWMFHKKGWFSVKKTDADEEKLMSVALDAGAEDIRDEDEDYEVVTQPEDFESVKKALDDAGIPYGNSEVTMLPQSYISLTGKAAEQMVKLMEALEDNDDVQKVYTNADIAEDAVG